MTLVVFVSCTYQPKGWWGFNGSVSDEFVHEGWFLNPFIFTRRRVLKLILHLMISKTIFPNDFIKQVKIIKMIAIKNYIYIRNYVYLYI